MPRVRAREAGAARACPLLGALVFASLWTVGGRPRGGRCVSRPEWRPLSLTNRLVRRVCFVPVAAASLFLKREKPRCEGAARLHARIVSTEKNRGGVSLN
ncbi:hypothetical protein AGIG_G9833 [Arapaima gigas]